MPKPIFPLGPQLLEGESPVEILESRIAYKNFVKVERYWLRTRLLSGEWNQPCERHIMSNGEGGHAVAVLLYEPERDIIILAEQFRMVNYVNGRPSAWTLEIPAGIMSPGEEPEIAARRETQEETGCAITHLEKICTMTSSPGILAERVHIYLARISTLPEKLIHGVASEGENIRVHVLEFDAALKLADEGLIDDAKTLLALNRFARTHDSVRHRWLNAEE